MDNKPKTLILTYEMAILQRRRLITLISSALIFWGNQSIDPGHVQLASPWHEAAGLIDLGHSC